MSETREHGKLRFELSESAQADRIVPYCKAWRGKQSKPYAFYRFKTLEMREQWILQECNAEDRKVAFRAEQKAKTEVDAEAMVRQVSVGTILYTSWGYDQTNVDFYEVIERPSKWYAVVRKIGAELEETGFMCGRTKPKPGHYVSEPTRHKISPYGVTIDGHSAWVCGPNEVKSCSWYH